MRLASFSSFSSSPGWKRVFSSTKTEPSGAALIAALASLTLVQGVSTKVTRWPVSRFSDGTTCLRLSLGSRNAVGPAEVAEDDRLAALLGDVAQGRDEPLDARLVGDLALGHGHVEVGAHQHALSLEFVVIEGLEGGAHSCRWSFRRLAHGGAMVSRMARNRTSAASASAAVVVQCCWTRPAGCLQQRGVEPVVRLILGRREELETGDAVGGEGRALVAREFALRASSRGLRAPGDRGSLR